MTTTPTRIAPGPHLAPQLWDSIRIGVVLFPATPKRGGVKVKLKTASEWKEDKASGKDFAKATFQGRKVATGTIEFHFVRQIYVPSRTLMLDLDPNGPNADKPWPVEHPELAERGANRIIVKGMSELAISGFSYSFVADIDGWYVPDKAQVGGSKTPKNPVPGGAGGGITDELVKSGFFKPIALGEVQPGELGANGFEGSDPPDVDPGV